MKAKEFIIENKAGDAVKPRNFVAKNAMKTTSGAGAHKDKKRAEKQGDVKHKQKQFEQGVAEVSKATIDRYVSKASDAHGDADFKARMSKNDPDKRSYHVDQKKTAEKRRQGISRALDRMSKEGVDEMRGFRGVGGARSRENDENEKIDAMLRQQDQQRRDYEQSGKFWIKQKDTQQHISKEFIGKAEANKAALDLLKQQPDLRGNLVITAYGPGEKQEGVGEAKRSDRAMPNTDLRVGDRVVADTSKENYPGGHKQRVGTVTRVGQKGVHIRTDDNDEPEWHPYKIVKKVGIDEDQKIAELSSELMAKYKKGASADATAADQRGDYKQGEKRFSGIVKATKKQFANDLKGKK